MEVSHLHTGLPQGMGHSHSAGAMAMDNGDMDIDIDIDLGPIDDSELMQQTPNLPFTSQFKENPDTRFELAGDIEHISPDKIHVRGVDDLTTNDIRAYSIQHFPLEPPVRIEWIDDTSANIVYSNSSTALKALNHLTLNPTSNNSLPSLQLQVAKPFPSHPESSLEVRRALPTDQKRPRAYEASRFYMMHPEHDPREQRRQGRSNGVSYDGYNRRRYSHKEDRRRKRLDGDQGYSSTMYDDDSSTLIRRQTRQPGRRDSYSTHSSFSSLEERNAIGERGVRSKRHVDSYRPGRLGRPSPSIRNRSASPGCGNSDRQCRSRQPSLRKRTPPPPYQSRDPLPAPNEKNHVKELFPLKPAIDKRNTRNGGDLFPNKKSAANLKKELFPNKTSISNHRRSDAFDAADETADLFATSLGLGEPSHTDIPELRNDLIWDSTNSHALTFGRLKSSDREFEPLISEVQDDVGLNIRGASKLQDSGFSIRGSAGNGNLMSTKRELFPGKAAGNAGKELFAERLQGRGGKRNRAVDMFS